MPRYNIQAIESEFAKRIAGMRFVRVIISGGLAWVITELTKAEPETAIVAGLTAFFVTFDKFARTKGWW